MHEGWHVAGMILTVQVVEKMRLEAQTTVQYRCAKLPSNAGTRGNDHTIRPGPLWGIRS
jgi:hypothetical protein